MADWVLGRCLTGWLCHPQPRITIRAAGFILLWYRRGLNGLWEVVADQSGDVFEDEHPHPVWNLLIFHGAVVEDTGNDDRLQ